MSILQRRRQNFGGGGGGTSNKISYMNSSQVLYCIGVAKIQVLVRHYVSSKTFEKFWKINKKLAQKFKKFFKVFQK